MDENKNKTDCLPTEEGSTPEEKNTEEKETRSMENSKIMGSVGLFSRLCVAMPMCILVGFFLGRFLDRVLSTSPTMLILFLILGIISSYVMLFRTIKKK